MPRNRRTVAPRRRPHQKVEEEPIDDNIKPDDKNVKVDLLLGDFDKGVETRIKELEAAHKKLLRIITRQYHVKRKSYTEDILNMKVSDYLDFLGKEGGAQPKMDMDSENEADVSDQDEEDEDCSKVMQTVHKKRGRRNVLGIISEENAAVSQTTRKRGTVNRSMAPPPSVTRSKFQTPAVTGLGRSRQGWETPMVTPKFDPRLPITAARRPKRGESVITSVFMSGKGSPIHASHPLLTIPTANNPNQGVSFFGGENIETVRQAFESFDPQMKENLKKMAKMMVSLTEEH